MIDKFFDEHHPVDWYQIDQNEVPVTEQMINEIEKSFTNSSSITETNNLEERS
jgi:hypothetical protein